MLSRFLGHAGWLWPLLLYLAIAAALWLPFGWRVGGLVEEWELFESLDRGEQLWWATPNGALSTQALRPLIAVPFSISHALGGGYFWIYVLLGATALALKGFASFMLVERVLPGRRAAAISAGALVMLYPANAGLFLFRFIHAHSAVRGVLPVRAGAAL